jgi:hypothetical protein
MPEPIYTLSELRGREPADALHASGNNKDIDWFDERGE